VAGESGGQIILEASSAGQKATTAEIKTSVPGTATHETATPESSPAGCCADVFSPVAETQAGGGSAAESQRAFGALMRSTQAAGALDEKTKELIAFSLVVQSRCGPCFKAHLDMAQKLGITRDELDEAAWCAIAMGGAPVRMFYKEALDQAQQAGGGKP
jgi:AhpD family alkylhydroperoxidase